jgi:hypothetical protein
MLPRKGLIKNGERKAVHYYPDEAMPGIAFVSKDGKTVQHFYNDNSKNFKAPIVKYIRAKQNIDDLYYDGSGKVYIVEEIWHKSLHPFSKNELISSFKPTKALFKETKMNIFAEETILGSKYHPYPVIITVFNSKIPGAKEQFKELKKYYESYSHLMYCNNDRMILVAPHFKALE